MEKCDYCPHYREKTCYGWLSETAGTMYSYQAKICCAPDYYKCELKYEKPKKVNTKPLFS